MQFEPNVGQTDNRVSFVSRGQGYRLFLTPTQAVFSFHSVKQQKAEKRLTRRQHLSGAPVVLEESALEMSLIGANPHPKVEGVDRLLGNANYFLGNNPKQWQKDVPTFAKVKYHQVYSGIDLVYYGNQRKLEYDFIIGPTGDPAQVALSFTGADRLEVDSEGSLIAHLNGGIVRWHKPYAYQEKDSGRKEVQTTFVLRDRHTVGFQVATYDAKQPLIIDPVLQFSTFLGGNDADYATGVALDSSGNIYVAGNTLSLNFPTANAYRSTSAGSNDVFVSKLNSSGTTLLYSTYLGGAGNEFTGGLAVDSSGNAYVAGATDSPNFPAQNAYNNAPSGFNDAFISKIGPTGNTLLYSSYLGGAGDDSANAIAVDNSGNAYIAGDTFSIGTGKNPFPAVPHNAYQGNNNGGPSGRDAFVAKFNTTLSGSASLVYSTFLGGSLSDEKAFGIAIDSSGNAYVTGQVESFANYLVTPPTPPVSDFPTLNAFQPSFNNGYTDPDTAGSQDGFLTELNSTGTGLIFSTFLGGSFDDVATGVTLDPAGRICVVGETYSIDFPTTSGAAQPQNGGIEAAPDFPGPDAFITVFQPNGAALYYSTYLGGSGTEDFGFFYNFGIAADRFGDIYVTGWTDSSAAPDPTDPTDTTVQFPITTGADQPNSISEIGDAFVTKINPAAPGPAGIVYSTFFGGDVDTRGTSITVDANGNFYVAGFTSSKTNIATAGAFRGTNSGGAYDVFVAKFSSPADISVSMFPSIDPVVVGSNVTYSIYINNNGRTTFTGVTNTVRFPSNFPIVSVTTSAGNYSTNAGRVTFNVGQMTNNAAITQTIVLHTLSPGVMTNTATLRANETELNTGNNVSTVLSTVQGIADVTLTASDAPDPVAISSNLTYTFKVTNKGPYPATSVVLTGALPASLSFVQVNNTSPQATWQTNLDGSFTCGFGTMSNNTSATVTLVMNALTNGIITNVFNVSAFEADFNTNNNTATVVSTVLPLTDLAIRQTAPNSVYAGNTFTYTLNVTNFGPSVATSSMVTDTLPPGTTFVSATSTQGGPPTQANGIVTCNLGTLGSNGTASVTITVAPMNAGTITNTATVTNSAGFDSNLANNSAQATTLVNAAADMGISNVAAPASTLVTSNVTFTITVTNRGPSTATGVVVTDSLPPGLSVVSIQSPPGSSTALANGVVTWNLNNMFNGASATMSILAQAMLDGSFNNAASVTSQITDLNPNNTANAAFTITPNPNAPLLKITRTSSSIILSWSTNAIGYSLQSKTNFSASSQWSGVTNVPVQLGNQWTVTITINRASSVYRLVKILPTLTAIPAGSIVIVTWTATAPPSGTLKAARSLTAPVSWSTVGGTPVLVGSNWYLTNTVAANNAFYRLFY
jgi:uncharacterized repeat protein (TIGR01451 family)